MDNSKIYKNVTLGDNIIIGDYVIIGKPPERKQCERLKTVIKSDSKVRSHTIIYAGNIIGDNFRTGHGVVIREYNNIGSNVSVGTGTDIEYNVEIEDNVRIHSQAFIPEYSVLKKGCWIGPNVVLTNAKYPKSKKAKENLRGPVIDKRAKIGANTTILPGKKIGKNSLIGAGSVVVDDIPPGKVAIGNPAKVIGDIYNIEEYEDDYLW